MTIAALTWPEAFVYVALIASVALVLAVVIWSMLSTGQTEVGATSRVVFLRDGHVVDQTSTTPGPESLLAAGDRS